MKPNLITKITLCGLLLNGFYANAQKTNLEVNTATTVTKIQPTMYGVFFEDINFAADGGLYAEMIKNRSFEFEAPLMGWEQPNSDKHSFNTTSGIATTVKALENKTNPSFCRVLINDAKGFSMINEGFRGMGIKKDAKYNLSLKAANHNGAIKKIIIQFIDKNKKVLGETSIVPTSNDWKGYTAQFTATQTEAKAQLKITFEGNGTIDLDMISLFPEDTWMNRKNGMRKDIVQLLYDMKPGFLRFPGGCIVEGRTLAQRYQWKKTVGDVEKRETLINRWNTEFTHKPAPDYFQTFGLGFFEYFQLSEDLGAQPLPILSCGMACQFNTGELVPMEELDPYVQDALDLIEFANGGTETPWGRIRSEMGHPKPFNLKYIGVGNEQWGPDYIERYKVFEKAIKAKYPKMIIVSGSGPFPEGDYFEYGMQELKKLNAEIVDEHYYKSPQWFRENATRYDSYDRKGPKIFAGEYAAQSVAIASPDNRNNWECAFSEAAFMTGLERNAEVVNLTSYAPLMAHEEAWQWTPDLLWFNNLEAYGSANYYVQKLFATNRGTDLIAITKDGKPVTGQNNLFASAVKDSNSKEVIVKLVNTSATAQEVNVDLKGTKLQTKGTIITLTSPNLQDENSFANPKKISPTEKGFNLKGDKAQTSLPPYSVTVLKLKMK
ncbi:MAG: alpha-L-arabinofuranosidase C-terminal domain-containing protein [Flavobacterium sp.]|uniref:alpha-L-arabinofuranosidase C-terminal domain-containing protein n=1 Tax=Flavobacterium sp. TaxID=239 RepID=UPI002735036A|nr:alpha-L-arabinofuranosidase C-terminal domain-containing protein [Flavobacterium sp.]MDP3681830.1 alpha-L-arabinofuranosidase C-terminal domain-containing protein [Flavobacterium sp.]MDZ4331404.1 alpha-L-arabinofuranosidase C-terminal domain-containing protein [Flavobacterium sp.]